jgi:hypothetical protein
MVQGTNALPKPTTTEKKLSVLTFFSSIYYSNNTVTKLNFFLTTYTKQFNHTKPSYYIGIPFLKFTKIPFQQDSFVELSIHSLPILVK